MVMLVIILCFGKYNNLLSYLKSTWGNYTTHFLPNFGENAASRQKHTSYKVPAVNGCIYQTFIENNVYIFWHSKKKYLPKHWSVSLADWWSLVYSVVLKRKSGRCSVQLSR